MANFFYFKERETMKNDYIAYAVCGETCGHREFIVDSQTQVCQYCGKLMFRTEVKKYISRADSGS
jgi:hypothetical protein